MRGCFGCTATEKCFNWGIDTIDSQQRYHLIGLGMLRIPTNIGR
jgi:hypothetical protein